jgi:hypothetical protein
METLVGIIALALLLICLALAGTGCSSRETPGRKVDTAVTAPVALPAKAMTALNREEIRTLLKTLAATPTPKEHAPGAMCYALLGIPNRVDYLCPKCGERTLYFDSKQKPIQLKEGELVIFVWHTIPECRRVSQELPPVAGKAVTLDETQFCRKCFPEVTAPKLVLHIAYGDGKTRDVEDIKADDLRILRDFLAGKVMYRDYANHEMPLNDSLSRLQELLGMKLDDK